MIANFPLDPSGRLVHPVPTTTILAVLLSARYKNLSFDLRQYLCQMAFRPGQQEIQRNPERLSRSLALATWPN
jgi:hypothetical protein